MKQAAFKAKKREGLEIPVYGVGCLASAMNQGSKYSGGTVKHGLAQQMDQGGGYNRESPAYKKALEIDTIHSPLYTMLIQQNLLMKLMNAESGSYDTITNDMISQRLMDASQSVTLRAMTQFHDIIDMMAKYSGVSTEQFASSINQWDSDKLVPGILADFFVMCRNGLLPNRMKYLSAAMKGYSALNLVILMSSFGDDEKGIQKLYSDVINDDTLKLPEDLEKLAQRYANLILDDNTDTIAIRELIKAAGDNAERVRERAAQWLVVSNAMRHYRDIKDHDEARQQYLAAIHASAKQDFRSTDRRATAIIDMLEGRKVTPESIDDIIHAATLDWEVLPPGELEKTARDIVGDLENTGHEVTIDLERLTSLEKIRQAWGADRCYYAKGKLGKRKVIRKDGKAEPDKYLVLVMQELDGNGSVIAEHAVAQSPIVGPHAMYLFRQDVSKGLSWRDVLALPKKKYAQALGARPIKHVLPSKSASGTQALPTAMATKVGLLMACTVDEFRTAEFSGDRGLRIKKTA